MDQDAVIRYMVVHNFLCNDDSYTGMMVHNYYLYEKDGVMSMIPWDYNLSMGAMGGGMGMTTGATDTVNTAIDTLVTQGEMSSRPMAAWIFNDDDTIALYHTVYQEFMDKAVEEGWFTDELEKVANMIAPYVEKDPTAFCTYEEFQKGVQSLKEFCGLRCESINGQLSGTIPSTSSEQKLNSSSLIDASSINLSDMGNFNGSGTQDGAGGMKGPDFQGSGAWNQMPLPDAVPVGQEESPVSSENEPTKESAVGNSQDNPPHDMPSPMEPGESPQRNAEVAWPLLAAAILTLMIGILLTVKLKAHNS